MSGVRRQLLPRLTLAPALMSAMAHSVWSVLQAWSSGVLPSLSARL
jgi:hypothetical protein